MAVSVEKPTLMCTDVQVFTSYFELFISAAILKFIHVQEMFLGLHSVLDPVAVKFCNVQCEVDMGQTQPNCPSCVV